MADDSIAAAIFFIIFVLLFPITLICYVIWIIKDFLTGNASNVSRSQELKIFMGCRYYKLQ